MKLVYGCLIAIAALSVGMALGFAGSPRPAAVTVAPDPPPNHVEWTDYPVGGYGLVSPEPDSTGHYPVLTIPDGSVLSVPHTVGGPDPVTERQKS